ncbi:MAG: S8 family serine peptidase [Actinomycetota bacterium]|nr:S8 family serine peptidase [Actinomycetota bacterium]
MTFTEPTAAQYVLLPVRGLRATEPSSSPQVVQFLTSLDAGIGEIQTLGAAGGSGPTIRVLDSIGPDGAKLVELTPESAMALRVLQPELQLVPVVFYSAAVVRRPTVTRGPKAVPGAVGDVTLQVVSATDGTAVAGAIVVAYTNYAASTGAQGVSDSQGNVTLALGGSSVPLDRLYVYPLTAFWSLRQLSVTVTTGNRVSLSPLDLTVPDALRYYFGGASDAAGAGVTVAVIDTGVANHRDLVVSGGASTVTGEDPTAYGDNGTGHGTHVAGIIAARGNPPTGLRGVAPGVTLRSYRVCGQGSLQAASFSVAKAIDMAASDGCDLINMSLGTGILDPVLKTAVEGARAKGSLCIIAAGNGNRGPVGFPASDAMAVAVSALGRNGTFPATSAEADDVAAPFGTDSAAFVASFTNIGTQIGLIGPGVGVMSTVPGGYAEISGTSMSCAAGTGAAARIVAASPVLHNTRDAARSAAMVSAILGSGAPQGFGPQFEGHGLPMPPA